MTPALGPPKEKRDFSILDIDLPETDDIKELCRFVTLQTTKRLIEIALDPDTDAKDALVAIKELNDRGHGKPSQTIQHEVTVEQIDRDIAWVEKKLIESGMSLDSVIDVESEEILEGEME